MPINTVRSRLFRARAALATLLAGGVQTASLDMGPVSTGTRLRNAMIDGYRTAIESALDLLLFLLREGPRLVFWGIVLIGLAWPLRIAWRTSGSRLRAPGSGQ